MTVQVEVGRATMTLGEILDELEVGASIRLDRHAGDPVEVYVNGALFARAEVVVLQDQIGARIIELVGNARRTSLGTSLSDGCDSRPPASAHGVTGKRRAFVWVPTRRPRWLTSFRARGIEVLPYAHRSARIDLC